MNARNEDLIGTLFTHEMQSMQLLERLETVGDMRKKEEGRRKKEEGGRRK